MRKESIDRKWNLVSTWPGLDIHGYNKAVPTYYAVLAVEDQTAEEYINHPNQLVSRS